MVNVLFIYPNMNAEGYIQVGLALLSAILKKGGHKTELFDTTFYDTGGDNDRVIAEKYLQFKKIKNSKVFEREKVDILSELKKKIKNCRPDLIAATCTSNDYGFLKNLLIGIKKDTNIPVILGGPHPTVTPEKTIEEDFVDMICVGEGEYALLELCDSLSNKKDITSIKNLWVKKDGKIFKNSVRPLLHDLDSLPYLDWTIFDEKHHYRPFSGKVYYFGWFEFGRGCPFACNYCINPYLHQMYKGDKFYRAKSPIRMIEEIKYFKENYPLEFIRFVDETFLAMPIEKIEEFAELYKKEINLPFIMSTRVESINSKTVEILKNMGTCKHVSMGIESGSERIRKDVCNRHMDNKKIVEAFKLLRETGIKTTAFNMIGFPTETRENIFETIEINRDAKPEFSVVSFFYPYEGTPLRKVCLEKGYIKEDSKVVNYAAETILDMPQITQKELKGIRKTFNLYVKSPKILFPIIKIAENNNFFSNEVYNIFIRYHNYILNKDK